MDTDHAKRADHAVNTSDLWMIEALIQPFRLDAVTLALEATSGFRGMTVTSCRGFGREKVEPATRPGAAETHRSNAADVVDFTEKVKLEVAVHGQASAAAVIDAIARTAHTGRRGDGKIFAWPLARAVRIQTFEEGEAAL